MHDEVQELLDEARLEGWREGMEEGYRMGKKKGVEDEAEECKKSMLEGYELGTQGGKEDEQRKWLSEGHGPGICISAQRHTEGMEKSDESNDSKEGTWKHRYGYCVSVEKGHLMLVTDVVKAMALKEAELTTWNDSSTQTDTVTTTSVDTQTIATPERQC
jgi:hypothetical protein